MSSLPLDVFCSKHMDSEAPISVITDILSKKDPKKFQIISDQFGKLEFTKVKDLARATLRKASLVKLPKDTPSLYEAIEIYNERLDNLLKSAESEHKNGNFINTQNLCKELLTHKPTNINVILLNAESFFNCGKYDECIDCLEKAKNIDPNSCNILNNFALVYMKKSENDLAKQYLFKVCTIQPLNEVAWTNYADFLVETNDLISAEQVYIRVLNLNPELYEVRNKYGSVLFKLNQINEAENQFKIAYKCAIEYSKTLHSLADVDYKSGNFEIAIPKYIKVLELNPGALNAWFNLGMAHIKCTEYQKAANAFLTCIELDPENVTFLKYLGITYYHQKKLTLCVEKFKKCLKLQPDNFDLNLELGLMYLHKIQNYHKAAICFVKCTELNPGRIDLYEYLLSAYRNNKDYPNASDTCMSMGDLYLKRNDQKNAHKSFNDAILLVPGNVFGHWKLGLTMYNLGLKDLALKKLKYAARLKPNLVNVMIQLTGRKKWIKDKFQLCSSWWCPKHGNLQKYMPYLNPETRKEKIALRFANTRQKYWITKTKVKCCVLDRKLRKDKHLVPPACYSKYIRDLVKTANRIGQNGLWT